jgi:2-oxoglutarate ferredoxin oxidoreductase subunit alpha
MARDEGLKVGLLRLKTLWPFPEEAVQELCRRDVSFLVPEMNLGQLVLEVERTAVNRSKVRHLSRVDGELFTPQEILFALKEELK